MIMKTRTVTAYKWLCHRHCHSDRHAIGSVGLKSIVLERGEWCQIHGRMRLVSVALGMVHDVMDGWKDGRTHFIGRKKGHDKVSHTTEIVMSFQRGNVPKSDLWRRH